MMKSRVGSHFYASPELLKDEPYDASIDLWGLGHVLYYSLTASHAFDNSLDVYGDVCRARVDYGHAAWADAPDARALCETLLCATPAERPTPRALLSHRWLLGATRADRRVALSLHYLGRLTSMREVCLRCLVEVLPAEHAAELRRVFDSLDSDTKGYLNAADVRRALKPPKRQLSSVSEDTSRHGGGARGSSSSDESADGDEPKRAAGSVPPPPGGSSVDIPVAPLLRRLLQSALQQTGVGRKHRARRAGRDSVRAAHGARRVGVVSFHMFAEAALECDAALCRRHWNAAFARLDADRDGVVAPADVKACVAALGGALSDEAVEAMCVEAASGRANATDLLRLVLKGEDDAVAAVKARRESARQSV